MSTYELEGGLLTIPISANTLSFDVWFSWYVSAGLGLSYELNIMIQLAVVVEKSGAENENERLVLSSGGFTRELACSIPRHPVRVLTWSFR